MSDPARTTHHEAFTASRAGSRSLDETLSQVWAQLRAFPDSHRHLFSRHRSGSRGARSIPCPSRLSARGGGGGPAELLRPGAALAIAPEPSAPWHSAVQPAHLHHHRIHAVLCPSPAGRGAGPADPAGATREDEQGLSDRHGGGGEDDGFSDGAAVLLHLSDRLFLAPARGRLTLGHAGSIPWHSGWRADSGGRFGIVCCSAHPRPLFSAAGIEDPPRWDDPESGGLSPCHGTRLRSAEGRQGAGGGNALHSGHL